MDDERRRDDEDDEVEEVLDEARRREELLEELDVCICLRKFASSRVSPSCWPCSGSASPRRRRPDEDERRRRRPLECVSMSISHSPSQTRRVSRGRTQACGVRRTVLRVSAAAGLADGADPIVRHCAGAAAVVALRSRPCWLARARAGLRIPQGL